MGSYNVMCGATNVPIVYGEKCYGFILIKSDNDNYENLYINGRYSMLPIVVEGVYSDYGEMTIDADYIQYIKNSFLNLGKNIVLLDERQGREVPCKDITEELILKLFSYRGKYHDGFSLRRDLGFIKQDMVLNTMFVKHSFIEILLEKYRENPFLSNKIDSFANTLDNCWGRRDSIDCFDVLGFVINKEYKKQAKVYDFFIRYLKNSNTPILPSHYGGQEHSIGTLKIREEFYKRELKINGEDTDEDLEKSYGGYHPRRDDNGNFLDIIYW